MNQEIDRKVRLAEDPGDAVFADVAEELRSGGDLSGALEIALSGIAANPSCHLGRLALARIFYDKGWTALAVREVRQLCQDLPEVQTLKRLLNALTPDSQSQEQLEEATVAEAEVDLEALE